MEQVDREWEEALQAAHSKEAAKRKPRDLSRAHEENRRRGKVNKELREMKKRIADEERAMQLVKHHKRLAELEAEKKALFGSLPQPQQTEPAKPAPKPEPAPEPAPEPVTKPEAGMSPEVARAYSMLFPGYRL